MDIEDRVQRLEDRQAIAELRAEYCHCIDSRDWEGYVETVTEDAGLDYGALGTFRGREGAREFVEEHIAANLDACVHALHNPMIAVDGDTATGRWYVSALVTLADGRSGLRFAQYRDRYRRVDGNWKIAEMEMRYLYHADFDEQQGWPDLTLVARPK